MKYNLDEVINMSIMTRTPTIIVEGYDDIKFYSNIAYKIDKNVNVIAVESIEGYGEGCTYVIKAIEDMQSAIIGDDRVINYILGIIDRDARYYRNELPEIEGLFVLKAYSYESHLITRRNLAKLLELLTKVGRVDIESSVVDFLMREFQLSEEKAYYLSLEALKNACETNYESIISYSDKPAKLFSEQNIDRYYNRILEKKGKLDEFADEHGITMHNAKEIIKGKWLLYTWGMFISKRVKMLYTYCGTEIPKCQMCLIGKTEKCMWRTNSNFQVGQIESYLLTVDAIDMAEVEYIAEKINQLG